MELHHLNIDPWIASSLMQKAIRRSETATAQRAALTLYRAKKSAIFRRLLIIAFEDVGIGSVDALIAVAAAADATARREQGGDIPVLLNLIRKLSEAPKDRSADYLCVAEVHPDYAERRAELDSLPVSANLMTLRDNSNPLQLRGLAAWAASDFAWGGRRKASGDLGAVFRILGYCGAPDGLRQAAGTAVAKARTPLALMVPLAWTVAQAGSAPAVIEDHVPLAVDIEGVPMYAMDKHTRGGREAIRLLARQNPSVRACLETYAPGRTNDAAYMAAFYADAMPTARRLVWDCSTELETFGIEADMLSVGVAKEGIGSLLQVFRENLDHLNELRGEVYRRNATARSLADRSDRFGWKDGDVTFFKKWEVE